MFFVDYVSYLQTSIEVDVRRQIHIMPSRMSRYLRTLFFLLVRAYNSNLVLSLEKTPIIRGNAEFLKTYFSSSLLPIQKLLLFLLVIVRKCRSMLLIKILSLEVYERRNRVDSAISVATIPCQLLILVLFHFFMSLDVGIHSMATLKHFV